MEKNLAVSMVEVLGHDNRTVAGALATETSARKRTTPIYGQSHALL